MKTMWIVNIILGILSLIITFLSYYFYIRSKLLLNAEDAIKDVEEVDKKGEEKFKKAVDQVYSLIPKFAKIFFKKEYIENIVQLTFDKIEEYAKKQIHK